MHFAYGSFLAAFLNRVQQSHMVVCQAHRLSRRHVGGNQQRRSRNQILQHPRKFPIAGQRRELHVELAGQANGVGKLALKEDGSGAIVLGCAGMADLCADLQQRFGLPVIDGVAAAVKTVEALVSLDINTSKRGDFAYPLEKKSIGLLSEFSVRKR